MLIFLSGTILLLFHLFETSRSLDNQVYKDYSFFWVFFTGLFSSSIWENLKAGPTAQRRAFSAIKQSNPQKTYSLTKRIILIGFFDESAGSTAFK